MGYAGHAAIAAVSASDRTDLPNRMERALAGGPLTGVVSPTGFAALAVACDLLAAAAATLAARPTSGATHVLAEGATLGLLTAMLGLARGDHAAEAVLGVPSPIRRALGTWLLAVALASAGSALAGVPRGVDAATVLCGALLLPAVRSLLVRQARRWALAGRLRARRVMLVGGAQEIAAFENRHASRARGVRLVSAAVLRDDPATLADDLALAVATARMRRPDGLILLLPWRETARIERSIEALRLLPVSIHLGPPCLDGAGRLCAEAADGVPLVKQPLSPAERRLKRAVDLGAASAALVLLAPVFCAVALAIRLDSPGPVFFRQRRTGYNGQPFRILKFRSMRTMEDGAGLRQVTLGDSRVTRVGRLLRRSSLDELPQLLNVLRGEMSLIGPRPHALAHDLAFGRTHGRYPRRHAVKPGITGWAQVSGFRGETDTAEKIEGRVRHDLAYVDNWSLRLDVAILLRTLFSPKTYHNAR